MGLIPCHRGHRRRRRRPPPTLSHSRRSRCEHGGMKLKYAVAIGCGAAGAILVVLTLLVWCLCRRPRRETMTQPMESADLENTHIEASLVPQLSVKQIIKVTRNFHDKLGEGRFGEVFKGTFQKKPVAVKRLLREQKMRPEVFKNEVEIMMRAKHRNVVKLLAYCNEGEDMFLCFEYMSGGSLDKLIYAHERNSNAASCKARHELADWGSRYSIIKEICAGLHYLHVEWDNEERIFHMDLKANNVLIDHKDGKGARLNVKIADFGISKLFQGDQTHEYINNIVGVLPYMAPEYINKGKLSEKVDIYSFGMLLVEMVTGLCANNTHEFPGPNDFINKVRHAWVKADMRELLDRNLRAEKCDIPQVRNCIEVAFDCLQEEPEKRPGTAEIAQRLIRSEDNAAAN